MREIKEGNVIQDCLQEGFEDSEIKTPNDGPTFKNKQPPARLNPQQITDNLTTKISGAVRASIEAQVMASADHGGSSFLRMLKSLRMSGLDNNDDDDDLGGLFSEIKEEEDEGQSEIRSLIKPQRVGMAFLFAFIISLF